MSKEIIYYPNRALNANTKITFDRITTSTSDSTNATSNTFHLASWLSTRWTSLVRYFTEAREPKIRQKRTAAGDVFYHAYDPYSGRSAYLTSDTDLRIWLEQLPYQQ